MPSRRVKKFIAFFCAAIVLRILVGFFLIEVPMSSWLTPGQNKLDSIENKINVIENKLSDQVKKTNELLVEINVLHTKQKQNDKKLAGKGTVLPVLVMSCNRVSVSRCLDKLLEYRPDDKTFPIIISQDCNHKPTYEVLKSYKMRHPGITIIKQPDQSEIQLEKTKLKFRGYYKIARHFKFALTTVLTEMRHDAVIIVEDDLEVAPDFYEYFLGTYGLLKKDPSIWCISAWNDNGRKELIDLQEPQLLHRTDFFPGLGWLLTRDTWLHLQPIWPKAFFDDWLRNPVITQGRSCIRPEISRTYSFGKEGVSRGMFFDNHLRHIVLNKEPVKFTQLDLSYLIKDKYDKALERIYDLPNVPIDQISTVLSNYNLPELKITYKDARDFKKIAKALKAMQDFRSGVPRTAYRGVVSLFVNDRRLYIVPAFEWTKYDPSWT